MFLASVTIDAHFGLRRNPAKEAGAATARLKGRLRQRLGAV
jgi:hypothetical protein